MTIIEHRVPQSSGRGRPTTGEQQADVVTEAPDFLELRQVVHDIRQPLAAMRCVVAELRVRFDDPLLHDRLDLMDSQVSLLDELVGSVVPNPSTGQHVDLSSVTARAIAAFRQLHPTVTLVSSVWPAAVANMDELTWWRVVQNLLDNAARAAGPDGSVEISLHAVGDDVILQIDDDGQAGFGMLPSGESLGLRFVIRSVHARGGRISLEALPAGGTSVVVSLPALTA